MADPLKFFSVLEEAIKGSKARSLPVDQWESYLRPGTRQVRQGNLQFPLREEELKWSGLPGLFDEKRGSKLSIDELLETLGGRPLPKFTATGQHDALASEYQRLIAANNPTALDRWSDLHPEFFDVTPGGQHQYKQHVLTGPMDNYGEELTKFRFEDPYHTALVKWAGERGITGLDEAERGFQSATGRRPNDPVNNYRSSHFGKEGQDLLSHSRWSRRGPLHLIEELQSDWHQAGRERGYKGDSAFDSLSPEDARAWHRYQNIDVAGFTPEMETDMSRIRGLLYDATPHPDAPPRAPFSKTWHELEMRKNLLRGATEGADLLGLTTGTQQADRWNQLLSKDLDAVGWYKSPGGIQIMPYKKGSTVAGPAYNAKDEAELRGLIGKEMADKIMRGDREGKLTGDNLSIGGAGMRHTYDDVYGGYLSKLAKQYGTGSPRLLTVSGSGKGVPKHFVEWLGDRYETWARGFRNGATDADNARSTEMEAEYQKWKDTALAEKIPAFQFTEEGREQLKRYGVPLFADGGQVPEEPGVTLLGAPPTLRDPFKEQFQARGPVGGADLNGLLALATKNQPTRPDPAGLTALLAKLSAPPPPATPTAAAPPEAPDPYSSYDAYLAKLRVPDPDAVNKDTGATGTYDFIPSTFRGTINQFFPDLAKLSDEELVPLMKDPKVARQVAIAFTQGNERHLASKGLPASDYTRFLAHWFGPAGAVDLLTGDENRKMEDWFEGHYKGKGRHWAKANALEGKTAAEVLAIAKKRMAGRG